MLSGLKNQIFIVRPRGKPSRVILTPKNVRKSKLLVDEPRNRSGNFSRSTITECLKSFANNALWLACTQLYNDMNRRLPFSKQMKVRYCGKNSSKRVKNLSCQLSYKIFLVLSCQQKSTNVCNDVVTLRNHVIVR